MEDTDERLAAVLAKAITVMCVRAGLLERFHRGTTPSSVTGDYSDVKVVTPYGEIPWPEVSRIDDDEMKRLMKDIVDHIYTFLGRQDDPAFIEEFIRRGGSYAAGWDEPVLATDFIAAAKGSGSRE